MNDSNTNNLFVIAKRDSDQLVTSVFAAGPDGEQEAVSIFTSESNADVYLHQAGWVETETPAELEPAAVVKWLRSVEASGVSLVAIDPDHVHQSDGIKQRILSVSDLLQLSEHEIVEQLTDSSEPVAQ